MSLYFDTDHVHGTNAPCQRYQILDMYEGRRHVEFVASGDHDLICDVHNINISKFVF